jgi:hypothetical protein
VGPYDFRLWKPWDVSTIFWGLDEDPGGVSTFGGAGRKYKQRNGQEKYSCEYFLSYQALITRVLREPKSSSSVLK